MRRLLRESAVYALGAAGGLTADVLLLWLLVEQFELQYLVAATISFLVGTIVVYWVSVRHAFGYRRIADTRTEFGYFATIGAIGVLLNLILMFSLVELAGLHYLSAKLGAAAISFTMNFCLRKWLLFSERGAGDPRARVRSEQH